MKKEKSIIIIGAGIAGLSAGYYGSVNGFKTNIFEKGEKAGGQCTNWRQGDYAVNGCIYWLLGSGPGNEMHELWQELGALQHMHMFDHDRFIHFENVQGKDVVFYCDPAKLRDHWLDLAAEEESFIRHFTHTLEVLKNNNFYPERDNHHFFIDLWAKLNKSLTGFQLYREIQRWSRYSCSDIAHQLTNPHLKTAFSHLGKDMPVLAILFTLSWMSNRQAGYPIGGSAPLINNILTRYLSSGGAVVYNAPVKDILVEDGSARGIVLEDGQTHLADYVISTADGHTTIYEMLQGRFTDKTIDHYYRDLPLFEPILFASFGVRYVFRKLEASVSGRNFPLAKTLRVGRNMHDRITVQIYHFDPTLAPAGKTLLTSILETDYDYWKTLALNSHKYQQEKDRILQELQDRLTEQFLAIKGKIETAELATPLTYERYTGVFRGSYEGWQLTTATFREKIKKTLPGLAHFYMAGQWVEPGGGLPPSALSGKQVIRMICREEDKQFITSLQTQATF